MQEASDKKKLIGVVVLVAACVGFLVWQLIPRGESAPSAQDAAAEQVVQQQLGQLPPSKETPVSGGKKLMGSGSR